MSLDRNALCRSIPAVDAVLARPGILALIERHSRELITQAARSVLDGIRQGVLADELDEHSFREALAGIEQALQRKLCDELRPSLRRVVNATGIILQTNLGRAPLAASALERLTEAASGYSNLEYDLATGQRSRRDEHADSLMLKVLLHYGAPAAASESRSATVVNNCAGATFLALNALAEGREVIVSRGELVEIGGGFRIPDILQKSGARLVEVGTTNKTSVQDYERAITPQTRLILRVHRSNFAISGFTSQPSLDELVTLGRSHSVPVFEDQGTGCIADFVSLGLEQEATVTASLRAGVSLVACSGDKLLGGPQCGLLVGDAELIRRVRSNPLFRALRVDKLTYAALQDTLLCYLRGDLNNIPLLRMLRMPAEQVRMRCESWASALAVSSLRVEVVSTECAIGGGTTPGRTLPSFAVALAHPEINEESLAGLLRGLETPVIGRIQQNRVLLDLRTVSPDDDGALIASILHALPARDMATADTPGTSL